jgi:hypothetical protein
MKNVIANLEQSVIRLAYGVSCGLIDGAKKTLFQEMKAIKEGM